MSTLFRCVPAVLLILAISAVAKAEDTRVAVMSIQNDTRITVNYQIKWGDGGWKNFRLEPGQSRVHYWVYDYANQNRSPRPLVRFDEDLTAGARWRKHTLQPYAAAGLEYLSSRVYSFTAVGRTLRMLSLT